MSQHTTHSPAQSGDLVIDVRDARRRYGAPASSRKGASRGFDAVRGVDLQIHRGELFALLGTNGAGKTSLMEMIEGIAAPSGGSIRVLGKDPFMERSEVRRHTGIMLQDAGFPADLTVKDMAKAWAGTLTDPRPVAEALDLVDLGHRADVAIQSLSGGERRRLDLALAVMGRPSVLFLDEPTTGLDPESRIAAWDLIASLRDAGTTIMLTTHYLDEAARLADRLAIMHHGQVVVTGTQSEIVSGYPSRIGATLPADAPPLPPELVRGLRGDGPRALVETDDLQGDLTRLLAWAQQHDVRLGDLDARASTLEQAFLSIAAQPRIDDQPHGPDQQPGATAPTTLRTAPKEHAA